MDIEFIRERYQRLNSAGLWKLAKAMMDDQRQNLRAGTEFGDKREDNISSYVWDQMWDQFQPLVCVIEKLKQDVATRLARAFVGYAGDPDDLLDPDYQQHDPALRTRDTYLWLAENFRYVVRDTPERTSLDFSRAKSRPPTVLAIQLTEDYARAQPDSQQRRAMHDKILTAIRPFLALKKPAKNNKQGTAWYAGEDS